MNFKNFDSKNYDIIYAGILRPALNESREPITHKPCLLYNNKKNYPLLENGNRDFCYCVLTDSSELNKLPEKVKINLPKEPGVYLWVINGIVQYVGRATGSKTDTLYSRFRSGYGNISPKNCYKGGQSTNIKMNGLVLDSYRNKEEIKIYYILAKNSEDAKCIEADLISTNWERKELGLCLTYNARKEKH